MRSVSKDEGVFVGVAVGVPNTPSSMKKKAEIFPLIVDELKIVYVKRITEGIYLCQKS